MPFIFASTLACAARSASFAAAMHQVGEQLGIVRVDRLRVDAKLLDLAARARDDGDHAAARRGLGGLLRRLLLQLLHLLLHLLRLLHQVRSCRSSFVQLPRVEGALHQLEDVLLARRRLVVLGRVRRRSPSSNATASLRPVTS